ncbi:MAG: ATP-binding protein [Candidatus Kerfeldbacteria bacterium]
MPTPEERKTKRIHALWGIIIGRWFLIFGLALLGVILKIAGVTIVSFSLLMLVAMIVIPVIINSAYTLYMLKWSGTMTERRLEILSFLQVFVDQLVFTLIIYFTGGIESVAIVLFFFPVLSATILYSDLKIISLSLFMIFLYTAMIILEYNGVIPHFARYYHDPGFHGNAAITLANTISVDLMLVFTAMFSVFVNRIIHDRELEIVIERDKVQSILNSLEDGIIMLDANKSVLLMNPPARDILRFYGEVFGPELRREDFPKAFSRLIQVIREQPESKRLGQEVQIEEGENKNIIQVDSIPIYAADGSVVSWVKVLRDITREKELDEIKSDFISVAAHQLRTPLAALKWFFKMMREGDAGRITKKQAALLDKAFDRSNEIIEIVNNLLDISEIEEGRFPYEFAEVNIDEVMETIVKGTQIDAEHKGVTVVYNKTDDELPPVDADKQKIRTAMQNLVDNAVKYSPRDSTVTVTASVKNNRFFITVEDQGIGIPKEDQQKIFTKFFRGQNAKEKETAGSGLGLYIVKNVIGRHRGQLWFESEVGKGTSFYISLPVLKKYLKK